MYLNAANSTRHCNIGVLQNLVSQTSGVAFWIKMYFAMLLFATAVCNSVQPAYWHGWQHLMGLRWDMQSLGNALYANP